MNREKDAIDGKNDLHRRKRTVLAEYYCFTDKELDFILDHDTEYRMGREG